MFLVVKLVAETPLTPMWQKLEMLQDQNGRQQYYFSRMALNASLRTLKMEVKHILSF